MTQRTYKEVLASVETRLDDFAKEQDRLTNTILGNGREGVIERLTRVEENLETATTTLKELTTTVADHVKDDCHSTKFDKKFLGAVVVVTGGLVEAIHQIINAVK